MKKLAILFGMLGVSLGSALAQGTIAFQNINTFPLRVQDAAGNVTTVGSAGSPLGPSSIRVGLFIGGAGATFQQMTMIAFTTNSPSSLGAFAGTFFGGNPYALPTNPNYEQNDVVSFAFAAWSIASNALTLQDAINSGIGYAGVSTVGGPYTLQGGGTPPTPTFGTGAGQISGFTLQPVPEPSTIALGLLGAAALFLRRRK